jgi:hypothetical protein
MRLLILTALLIACSGCDYASPVQADQQSAVSLPSPASSAVSPSPGAPLTANDSKTLMNAFVRAQENEVKALRHRNASELSELKAAQKAKQNDWDNKERDARHKFFADHPKGPDRRAYIGDYMNRRKAFVQSLSDEKSQRLQNQDKSIKDLQEDQRQRLDEFKSYLLKGERPPAYLWPPAGT